MADDQPDLSIGDQGMPKHTPSGTGELSVREAANSHLDWQRKLRAGVSETAIERPKSEPPPVSQPEAAPEAPAADESAPAADANPDEGHGETQKAEAADEPPIEPPVSWTTAEKERWQSIPRETQEYITQRETERERLLTQKSKEAEEQLKGLSAREQAMEQARLQFEAINQAQLQALQATLQGEFSDIQNMEDVKKLANEDWARYLRWDAHQKDIAAKTAQANEAQQRQATAQQERFLKFAQEQDKKFIERVPEFADKDRKEELQKAAVNMLTNIGFSEDELFRHWHGQDFISLRDARIQEAFHKAAKYDAAQAAAKKTVANKTLPPVQRPGVAQQGSGVDGKIQDLIRRSRNSTGIQQLRYEAEIQALRQERSR